MTSSSFVFPCLHRFFPMLSYSTHVQNLYGTASREAVLLLTSVRFPQGYDLGFCFRCFRCFPLLDRAFLPLVAPYSTRCTFFQHMMLFHPQCRGAYSIKERSGR